MTKKVDVIVVGQGLAGATLAWRLLERGASILVVDKGEASASRVAAGLVAPVGGKRLALMWRAAEAWDAAIGFYKQIERILNRQLLRQGPLVRLFVDQEQRTEFERRRANSLATMHEGQVLDLDPDNFATPLGGFLARGARLDVPAYLAGSRDALLEIDSFVEDTIHVGRDVCVEAEGVMLPRLDVRAKQLVLCRGHAEQQAGDANVPFEPAKGEVLTVRVPGLAESRVVQLGVWLAPVGGGLFRVGSTFDRDDLTDLPTDAGREMLTAKLRQFLRREFDVIDHDAGVRPIVTGRTPVVGGAAGGGRVGLFNGLGASGTLWAPWVADRYAEHLMTGTLLPGDIDLQQRFPV